MFVKIKGTGSCLPEKVLDNFEISQLVDTNDEWIQSRTGIKSRHIAREETAVSMAAKAAKRALEDAQVAAEEIDLLIVSSVSSEQLLPCTACSVQKEIGAVNAAAFDLNAACSGFIVAYQMAAGQIKAGLSKKALLIGVECLSNIVNWEDRGTCILFGDGARAAVVSADEDSFRTSFRWKQRRSTYLSESDGKESRWFFKRLCGDGWQRDLQVCSQTGSCCSEGNS